MFNYIQSQYNASNFTAAQVSSFVSKGWITADQYQQITGQAYQTPAAATGTTA